MTAAGDSTGRVLCTKSACHMSIEAILSDLRRRVLDWRDLRSALAPQRQLPVLQTDRWRCVGQVRVNSTVSL